MKKSLLFLILISLLILTGCAKSNKNETVSKKDNNEGKVQSNTQNDSKADTITKIPVDNEVSPTVTASKDNPYFFKAGTKKMTYQSNFIFMEPITQETTLYVNELVSLPDGKVYELKLEPQKDIPEERLTLGYFYVQKDKIYKLLPTKDNLNTLKSGKLPDDSFIVCQDEEIKDPLSEDESGWHSYLTITNDTREFHSYNNMVESGFFESFTWEKNKGLTGYRSGFGAERDLIELTNSRH